MITSYCKKCAKDVPQGDRCPHCGARLLKSSARVAWCREHEPVRDWMSWNAMARIIAPLFLAIWLVLLAASAFGGNTVHFLTVSLQCLPALLAVTAAFLFIILMLQGTDLMDCVVDSKGIHVRTWLTDPTPLKLLARFRSPTLMRQTDAEGEVPLLLINEADLPWSGMARVQLWPEKNLILCYAPVFWMRLCLYCTPFNWADVLSYMRDKVGRKKKLLLPPELVTPSKPKAARKKSASVPEQVRDAAAMAAPPAWTPEPEPDPWSAPVPWEDEAPGQDPLPWDASGAVPPPEDPVPSALFPFENDPASYPGKDVPS